MADISVWWKLEELPEDIKQQVLSLEIDEVSLPITTIDGVHIIKHGAQVAEQAVELSQIKPKIREVLRNQAVEKYSPFTNRRRHKKNIRQTSLTRMLKNGG